MAYSELFDGEVHWLTPDEDWLLPWLVPGEPVVLEVQLPALDELESPEVNYAPLENVAVSAAWAVEEGWPAFNVSLQYIGELLSPAGGQNLLQAEEQVTRDEKTWKVTGKYFRVLWKGDPDSVKEL